MEDLFEYYRSRIEALERDNENLRYKITELRNEIIINKQKNNRN
jgi:chaperonin cofactor prefoldin